MILEKGDLNAIQKVVKVEVDKAVDKAKVELRGEIQASEKRIISIISSEVTDLAEINYAVITKTDQLDHRLNVVERKLGIRV